MMNDRSNGGQFKPSNTLARAVTPAVRTQQPTAPNSKWDFAYVALDLWASNMQIVIDGVVHNYDDSYDRSHWYDDTLFANGIGVYSTFDSMSCWALYRFQNLTRTKKKVELRNAYNYSFGVEVLQNDPVNSNPTIQTSIQNADNVSMGGFDTISFTLDPNTKPELVGIHPKQVVYSPDYSNYLMYLKDASGNPFEYSFKINGVLVKDSNNVSKFTVTSQEELMPLAQLIEQQGLYLNSVPRDFTWNILEMGFSTVDESDDKLYTIELTQFGNPTLDRDTANVWISDYEASIHVVRGDGFVQFTAYSYDPLDLVLPE